MKCRLCVSYHSCILLLNTYKYQLPETKAAKKELKKVFILNGKSLENILHYLFTIVNSTPILIFQKYIPLKIFQDLYLPFPSYHLSLSSLTPNKTTKVLDSLFNPKTDIFWK